VAPGRPPDLQAGADADALVRLDHLTQVRLVPAPGSAAAGTTGGDPGSAGQGAGSGTTGGSGPAAGASPGATSAWFVGGGRRLVRVPLARLEAGGAAPTSTPTAPAPSPAPGPSTAPAPSTGAVPGSGGPAGATLVEGTVVRVWAVPPGAAAPAIDPFLRRAPS
jgi:hypothetical protein